MSAPLDPLSDTFEWNALTARHLLNRAGFGVPGGRIAELAAMPAAQAIDSLVDFDKVEDNLTEPDWFPEVSKLAGLRDLAEGMSEEEKRMMRQDMRREMNEATDRLKLWWLERMQATTRPLQEKLALFWHGHFATSAQKVDFVHHNYQINKLFRDQAAGNFKQLTLAVGKSPAMLIYLDNRNNIKQHPNENWARELMELFTLGIGNYTEDDIKEAARAFTGWSIDKMEFTFRKRQHDDEEKTFLGRKGAFTGEDILDIIFEQPQAAEFISRKLWEYFAYENPEPEIVSGLAGTLRQKNFELRPMLRQLFHSKAFFSPKAMGTQIKSPAQLCTQIFDELQVSDLPEDVLLLGMRVMGQELLAPPNVKGWPGNRAWINTNTLLWRYNLAGYLVTGVSMKPGRRDRQAAFDVKSHFAAYAGLTAGETADALAGYFLSRPLAPEQRAILIEALGAATPGDPVKIDAGNEAKLRGAVHLLLSTAEYQLC